MGFALHEIVTDQGGTPIDYRFLEVNDPFLLLTGWKGKELTGLTLSEVSEIHISADLKDLERFARVAHGGESETYRFYSAITETWYLVTLYSPARGRFITIYTEVESIQSSIPVDPNAKSEILTEFIKLFPDTLFVMDTNGVILEVYGEIPVTLGLKIENLKGSSMRDLVSPGEFDKQMELCKQCLKEGKCCTAQFTLTAGGISRTVEMRAKPLNQSQVLVIMRDLSEEGSAREALLEEQRHRNFLFSQDKRGIIVLNSDHKVIDVNPAYCEMSGYSESELKSFHSWHLDAHLDEAEIRSTLLADDLINDTLQTVHRRKDGSCFDVEITSLSISTGADVVIYCICEDITSKKAADREIRILKTAIDQTPSSVVITNVHGEIEYVNPAFSNLTGYTQSEAIGKNPNILKSGTQSVEFYEQMWNRLTSGEVWSGELHNRKKNGEYYWEAAVISPVKNREGDIIHYLAIKENITEKKILRDELLRFKTISDNSVYGLAITDLDGTLLYCNKSFARTHGYSEDELDRTHLTFFHTPEQSSQLGELLTKLKSDGWFGPVEVWHKRRDGTVFPMLMTGILIRNEIGDPQYMAASAIDLTEYKKTEVALAERDAQFKTLSDQIHNGIVYQMRSDRNGANRSFTFMSAGVSTLFGLTQKEVLNDATSIYSSIHPDDIERVSKEEAIAIEEIKMFRTEARIVHREGDIRWILATSTPRVTSEGDLLWDGIMIDISETIEARQKLIDSEEKYRIVSENTYHWEFWETVKGKMLYNSPSCERITGYRPEEFADDPNLFDTILHPDDREEYRRHRIKSWKIHGPDFCSFRIIRKDGELRYLDHVCKPAYNQNGEFLGIRGTNIDVTQRVQAQKKLEESELYHRSLLLTIPDLIFILDNEGTFIDFKSAEKNTAVPVDRFLNKKIKGTLPVEVANKQIEAIKKCRVDPNPVSFNYALEEEGKERHYSATTVPFGDDKVIVTVRDVTDSYTYLAKIERLLVSEEKQNENFRNFTHIVSHNLRIHTANMLGILMVLKMEQPDLFEDQMIQMLNETSEKLEETIQNLNDILNLKHISENEFTDVHLRDEVAELIKALKPTIQESGVTVSFDIDTNFTVRAVPDYLRNSLNQLLSNAIKYRRNDTDSFVKICAKKGDNVIRISVEDNGTGIDLERHLHQLFDMYKKFHDSPGSKGIGLFIAKNQIEAMGGTIEVKSEVNKGSTFTIILSNGKD